MFSNKDKPNLNVPHVAFHNKVNITKRTILTINIDPMTLISIYTFLHNFIEYVQESIKIILIIK